MNISLGMVESVEPHTRLRTGLGKKLGLTLIAITLASVALLNTLAPDPELAIALVEDGEAQAAEIADVQLLALDD